MCEIEGATRKWRERSVCFYLFRESTVLNENRSVTWFSSVVMLVSHMMVAQRLKKQIDYLPEHLIGQRNSVVKREATIQKYSKPESPLNFWHQAEILQGFVSAS